MNLLVKLAIIIVCSYSLGKITDRLIKHLLNFSKVFKIGQFEATAVVVALTTSLPEVMVSVSSSTAGISDLALGNAIGSNIVNLSLVMGITAVAGHVLRFRDDSAIKNKFLPLGYTVIPFLMLMDGEISRFDGIVLVVIYIIYMLGMLKQKNSVASQRPAQVMAGKASLLVVKILALIGMMVLASQVIVRLAESVASGFGMPVLFVGLFVVAVGTSLPELMFNIKAAAKRKVSMSMGNIVGSCVANSSLVIGLSAIIWPIRLENAFTGIIPGVEYMFIVGLVLLFVWSKHRLEWWEGLILVTLFFYYTFLGMISFS